MPLVAKGFQRGNKSLIDDLDTGFNRGRLKKRGMRVKWEETYFAHQNETKEEDNDFKEDATEVPVDDFQAESCPVSVAVLERELMERLKTCEQAKIQLQRLWHS